METISVYMSAEDNVTEAIIEKLLSFCSPRFNILKKIPARGGEIKKNICSLNKLAESKPVILLTDLDANDCPPLLKQKLLKGEPQSPNFIINIANDEAEAWLMADRKGFASYIGVEQSDVPPSYLQKFGGMRSIVELAVSCKSSWYLTHDLIAKSKKEEIKQQIMAQGLATKGKEYNSAIVPFIKNYWNIEEAMKNSDSLQRMVCRLKALAERLQ